MSSAEIEHTCQRVRRSHPSHTDEPPLGTDAGEAPEETETLPKDMSGGDGEEEDGEEQYGEEGEEGEEAEAEEEEEEEEEE